jgi:hypothetical protein
MVLSQLLRLHRTRTRQQKSRRLSMEALEDRTVPSVTIGASFDGMNTTNNSCSCQPPDTMEAAGPNHIVHMVNTAIEVFNKDGTINSAPQSTMSFFGNFNGNHSDPNVMYDEAAGKFVAGILDFGSTNAADQFDWATGVDGPSGITWTQQTPIASADGSNFWDYPRIGYNPDAWFFTGNMFSGSFVHIQAITVNKSTGAVISRHFDSTLFTLTPARMHDNTNLSGTELYVESANGGASNLQLVTESNDTSGSPSWTSQSVTVPSYKSGGAAPQGVAGFDDRIFTVAYRTVSGTGHLVAAHQIAGARKRSGPVGRIYDINPSTRAQVNFNTPAGVTGASTFMPSADINTLGSIGFNYGESASGEFWSMYVAERTVGGTMNGPTKVASGVSRSPDSRVGDFSNTTVDPADGTSFWGANEYQGADFWDTHIAKWSVAGAVHQPAIIATLPPGAGSLTASQTVSQRQNENAIVAKDTANPAATSQHAQRSRALPHGSSNHATDALFAELGRLGS